LFYVLDRWCFRLQVVRWLALAGIWLNLSELPPKDSAPDADDTAESERARDANASRSAGRPSRLPVLVAVSAALVYRRDGAAGVGNLKHDLTLSAASCRVCWPVACSAHSSPRSCRMKEYRVARAEIRD